MKVEVDYLVLIKGINNLKQGEGLGEKERQAIIKLLDAVTGDYVPTEAELEKQEENVKKLDNVDFSTQPFLWNAIMQECAEFESKYC
ncbi:MAG: hypothetical protein JXQ26_05415 [Tissierellales bacterium]|nr:hypothetical protein [Tissierellales bacterium]